MPEYIRPLFCEGKGPFRWVALSGDPEDISRTDRARRSRCFPTTRRCARWIPLARERVAVPGACPRASAGSATASAPEFGLAINELVRAGEVKAPIVIGRDHLDTGSVASPFRETEAMRDGSDAIADWPLLNALVNTAAGASGCASTTAAGSGSATRCTPAWWWSPTARAEAERRLERVLTSDPGMGVVRHADAGYPEAIRFAKEHGIRRPME